MQLVSIPYPASHIQATSSMVGAAATSAKPAKRRKYENLDSSLIFVPFGVETWALELFIKNYQKGLSSLPVILERAVTLAKELVWPSKGAMQPAS
ncbi:jg24547 [Pararge aegeria aegeria]|uniref:Jg24547 protein n=1 Tax=Pararge aegeria aegeria TaxID=348720 RepID=A0A8S4SLX3_9NEOP|nr:jg24547 [Pararge aegeria aegeria]